VSKNVRTATIGGETLWAGAAIAARIEKWGGKQ